uniref:(northern house mosquito) hypothetical protein n=1 Tax=Culex pipiens TaxID=7175 RepID=A0A8D8GSM1_CULPI
MSPSPRPVQRAASSSPASRTSSATRKPSTWASVTSSAICARRRSVRPPCCRTIGAACTPVRRCTSAPAVASASRRMGRSIGTGPSAPRKRPPRRRPSEGGFWRIKIIFEGLCGLFCCIRTRNLMCLERAWFNL